MFGKVDAAIGGGCTERLAESGGRDPGSLRPRGDSSRSDGGHPCCLGPILAARECLAIRLHVPLGQSRHPGRSGHPRAHSGRRFRCCHRTWTHGRRHGIRGGNHRIPRQARGRIRWKKSPAGRWRRSVRLEGVGGTCVFAAVHPANTAATHRPLAIHAGRKHSHINGSGGSLVPAASASSSWSPSAHSTSTSPAASS